MKKIRFLVLLMFVFLLFIGTAKADTVECEYQLKSGEAVGDVYYRFAMDYNDSGYVLSDVFYTAKGAEKKVTVTNAESIVNHYNANDRCPNAIYVKKSHSGGNREVYLSKSGLENSFGSKNPIYDIDQISFNDDDSSIEEDDDNNTITLECDYSSKYFINQETILSLVDWFDPVNTVHYNIRAIKRGNNNYVKDQTKYIVEVFVPHGVGLPIDLEETKEFSVDYNIKELLQYYNRTNHCLQRDLFVKNNNEISTNESEFLVQEFYYNKKQRTNITSCLDIKKASLCSDATQQYGITCVWVEDDDAKENLYGETGYCNVDNLKYVTCGDAYDIPREVPQIFSMIVNILKVATPIILIIVSIVTLLKALASSKEDEMKKAKTSLIKKVIIALLIFFVVSIVQFVIFKVADSSDKKNISSCLSCFLNNKCKNASYYKTNIDGEYYCSFVSSGDNAEKTSCDDFYKQ